MARGFESKKIVDECIGELVSALEFTQLMVPCIIPESDEDGQKLNEGLTAVNQLLEFIRSCDGDLSQLDELFDIDRIVDEYPALKNLLKTTLGEADE